MFPKGGEREKQREHGEKAKKGESRFMCPVFRKLVETGNATESSREQEKEHVWGKMMSEVLYMLNLWCLQSNQVEMSNWEAGMEIQELEVAQKGVCGNTEAPGKVW